MISDALTKRPIVEKHYKTNQMLWTEQDESQSVCLNQYLQVKYSFFFCLFYLTCTLKQSMHLHRYIQTS